MTLRLVFNLTATDPKNMEEYATLLKLAFFLVDKLSNYKLSSIVICLNCLYENTLITYFFHYFNILIFKFKNQNKAEKERQRVEEIRKKDEKEKRREVFFKNIKI